MLYQKRRLATCCLLLAGTLVAGCSSVGLNNAPVVDRNTVDATGSVVPRAPAPPGYYTVKPGDTLIRIGQETHQNWRDIARWNNLNNADVIEVGQMLRVAPIGATPAGAGASAAAAPSTGVVVQPIQPPVATTVPAAGGATSKTPVKVPGLDFIWPANGPVISNFNDTTNKGINIGGQAGDPIYAAGNGQVVYAGAGLRGYGNLIIIKHNEDYLTAYAHNRSLLVKEGQQVKRGQKIAEMGSTDADRVMLHFEVRRLGKPENPLNYLPRR